ncbi:MAG: glutathione peroxidase [Candidatus Omnitrophota bacterium]|jgi:glutaredoxin-like protein
MLKNSEGQKVPSVTFKTRTEEGWKDVTTDDLFKGKTVVVFSLPGAFTPTCSSTHVPGYNRLASKFKENGVDDIVCFSVNDAFVMNAWKKDQEAERITFIGDGNGEFSKGMGMLVDKSAIGFGHRSWRYSMLVKDGVIKKMFIEPEVEGDPFEVSDAMTMLKYLDPKVKAPKFATLFAKEGCPYCAKAKVLLKKHGYEYEEIPVTRKISSRSLHAVSGRMTTPEIFMDGKLIGGCDDLEKYLKEKK